MKKDNFGFILDVYWLSYAGINPESFIRKNKDNIACVHFKDMDYKDGKQIFAPVGYGNLDWDGIIDACKSADTEYALVEQDVCLEDPFLCLKKSYDYLIKKDIK